MSAERPIIDLSTVTWLEPYALIYLGMFLRHHNRQGQGFKLLQPRSNVKDYLTKQNFWNRFRFSPDPTTDRALLRFLTSTSFNDIIDLVDRPSQAEEIYHRFQDLLQTNYVKVDTTAVAEAVVELVDNFVQHANVGLAAMMVQYYPKKHELGVAIGDCGIGIRQSLFDSGRYPEIAHMSHALAITKAFEPMVTAKHEGGMGFETVRDIVVTQRASMFLSSNDGAVYIDNRGKMYYMDVPYDLPGVQLELRFPERRRRDD